jgi:hypothetical protein
MGDGIAGEDALGWAVEQDDQLVCRNLNRLVQVTEFDGELAHLAQTARASDQNVGRDEVNRHDSRRVSDQDVAVTEVLADAQEDSDAGSSTALAPERALGAVEPGQVEPIYVGIERRLKVEIAEDAFAQHGWFN